MFYKLPAILDHLNSRTRDLSIERQARWLAGINRKYLYTHTIAQNQVYVACMQ